VSHVLLCLLLVPSLLTFPFVPNVQKNQYIYTYIFTYIDIELIVHTRVFPMKLKLVKHRILKEV